MLEGDLIAQGENGERIDLHAMLVEQNKLNRWAARQCDVCAAVHRLQTIIADMVPTVFRVFSG